MSWMIKSLSLIVIFFSLLFAWPSEYSFAQEANPSKIQNDTLLAEARQYVREVRFCALVTEDTAGFVHARTMDPFLPDSQWVVWLATNPMSRKVDEIRNNPNVTLYYTGNNGIGYVSIMGTAILVNQQSKKDSLWKEEWSQFYKNRTDDYLLIKVIPKRLEILNYTRGLLGDKETWQTPAVTF